MGYTPSALIAFHFIHTGTRCAKDGAETTTFEGKSLRWLLTRVPQTRSFEAVNLKQVAQILSESLGAKIEFEGKGQTYQHLDMTGLTPFQLLSREAKSIGYRIADKGNKLILEPEARPEFTDFVIDEDVLISADFGDQARADGPSPGTATSQSDGAGGAAKSVLNLQSGQTTTLTPNTTAGTGKPTGDAAVVAGAAAAPVGGTVKQPGGTPATPEAAKPTGPEKRTTTRQEGDSKITEDITIERKEEPTQVTTTTTTVETKITVTNSGGSKTVKTTVETKVGTAKGTTTTTKVTDGNSAPVTTVTPSADIDPKFTRTLDQKQNAAVDQFGLPKQPPGIIDLADGRAEGLQIADEAKRIKGYESSAVLMSTDEVLQLAPGQIIALSSRLFPEPFDREWRISEVKHLWKEGTTTISIYTPQLPPAGSVQPSGDAATTATGATPPGALPVVCWSQRDNKEQPDRTCNTSSNAMAAKYLGAKINSDDEYFQYVRKYGDTTDHGVQTAALAELGIKSTYRDNLEFADLDAQLTAKKPIVIGIMHKGAESAPYGGHMIVVIGKTPGGDYIVNDPWGDINQGYAGGGAGCGVVYTRKTLQARWLDRGPGTGAGRIFL